MATKAEQLYINAYPNGAAQPAGNILQTNATNIVGPDGVKNQDLIEVIEPFGTQVPTLVKGRTSGWSQIQNISTNLDLSKMQAALRAAERGDTTVLFAIYRDMFLGTGMVAGDLGKRKLAVLSEPHSILPFNKNNEDDLYAADVISDMIMNCSSWNQSLSHLMNAVVFPIAISEKLFRPVEQDEENPFKLHYYLKEMFPVEYVLLNYRLPYLPQGPINAMNNMPPVPFPPNLQSSTGRLEDTIYDVDSFEPNLRLWHVFNNGLIDYSWSNIRALDPDRHLVYRCNLLNGIARDNFGGLGRSIMFWAFFAQLAREYYIRMLDKYGSPFIVAKVDTAQVDTVKKIEESLQALTKLQGIVINKDADIVLHESNLRNASDGHERFLNFCHDQISLLINGQTLSGHAQGTGMGSGVAKLQGQVRSDIISYDRLMLGTVLRNQLFKQFLKINGIKGHAPLITWGTDSTEGMKDFSLSIQALYNSGIVPAKEAFDVISEKFGFTVEKAVIDSTTTPPNNKPVVDDNNKDATEPIGAAEDQEKKDSGGES